MFPAIGERRGLSNVDSVVSKSEWNQHLGAINIKISSRSAKFNVLFNIPREILRIFLMYDLFRLYTQEITGDFNRCARLPKLIAACSAAT